VPSTLLAAINAGNFSSWPGFTADLVKKHLPNSQATIKGHLQQQRKNAWSTKKKTFNLLLQPVAHPKLKPALILCTLSPSNMLAKSTPIRQAISP
jgi:hypothetical protein